MAGEGLTWYSHFGKLVVSAKGEHRYPQTYKFHSQMHIALLFIYIIATHTDTHTYIHTCTHNILKSIFCMIPFKWSSKAGKTTLWSWDEWLFSEAGEGSFWSLGSLLWCYYVHFIENSYTFRICAFLMCFYTSKNFFQGEEWHLLTNLLGSLGLGIQSGPDWVFCFSRKSPISVRVAW